MIKRTVKRALSIVLTLVLVATTFFIFDPSTLKMDANAWINTESSPLGASLPAQRASAPETIYLALDSNNFQYYSNINIDTGVAGDSMATSGEVSFSNSSATDVTIYVNNLWKRDDSNRGNYSYTEVSQDFINSNFKVAGVITNVEQRAPLLTKIDGTSAGGARAITQETANAKAIAGGSRASSATYTFNNNLSFLKCNEGDVYVVEWVVEYKIGSSYHYTFMYTGIYKPRLTVTGVSAALRHTDNIHNTPAFSLFSFITGAMDYANKGNRYCAYTKTSGLNTAPLINFVGYENTGTTTIPYENEGDGNQRNTLYQSTATFPESSDIPTDKKSVFVHNTGTGENGGWNVEDGYIYTSYANDGAMGTYNSPVPTGTVQGQSGVTGVGTTTYTTGVAYQVVDRSRFTNFNQLPYLSIGAVRYYFYRGHQENSFDSIKVYDRSFQNNTAITVEDVDTGEHKATDDSFSDIGNAGRTWGLYKLSGAIPSSNTCYQVRYNYQVKTGSAGRNSVDGYFGVGLVVTPVNKDGIRKAYSRGLTSNIDKVFYGSGYSSYYTNMRTQARLLCDPTAANDTVSLAESNVKSIQDKIIEDNTADILKFYVPEVIYLNPSDRKTFQYYVDRENEVDGALNAESAKTTGNVYFNAPGATKVTVLCTTPIEENPRDIMNSTGEFSDTLTTQITGATLSTAVAAGSTTLVEWTATYILNGLTYTTKAYSVAYAPYTGVIAAAGRIHHTSSSFYNQSIAYVYGVHDVPALGSYSPKDKLASLFIDGAQGIYNTNGSAPDNKGSGDFVTNTAGTAAYTNYGDTSSDGKNCVVTAPRGLLYIDTSRITNLNQIPNFKYGHQFTDDESSDYYCQRYYLDDGTSNQVAPKREKGTSGNPDGNSSLWLKPTQFTGTVEDRDYAYFHTDCGTGKSHYIWVMQHIYVDLVKFSKADLREALNKEISTAKQEEWYTSASWTTYSDAIKAAADALGNPAASQATVSAALNGIGTGKAALVKNTGTAYARHRTTNGQNPSYAGSSGDTFMTETKAYNYGDKVTAGPEEFIGYTYVGGFAPKDFVNNTKSNPSGKLTSDDSNRTITFKSTASSGEDYSSYPGPNEDIDGYYYVPVTPGSTITFKFSVTGPSSQFFAFYAGANRKTLPNKDENNNDLKWLSDIHTHGDLSDSEQTLTFTVPSNCYYLTFRLGNHTPGGTTYFKNLRYTTTAPEDEAYMSPNVTKNTVNWDFYYEPNKYDVTYDPNEGSYNGETNTFTCEDVATYDAQFKVGQVDADSSAALPAVPTRTGYHFVNWTSNMGGDYDQGETITRWSTASDTTKFTANWEIKTYDIYYDVNGGTQKPDTNLKIGEFNYDATINIKNTNDSNNLMSREGWTLKGWSTKAENGTAIAFGTQNYAISQLVEAQNPADPETGNPQLKVFAVWEKNKYDFKVGGYIDTVLSDTFSTNDSFSGYGTATVTVGGTSHANSTGYTQANVEHGTAYSITDITPAEGHYYDGVKDNKDISGNVNNPTEIYLKFGTEKYSIDFNRNYTSTDTINLYQLKGVKYGSSQTLWGGSTEKTAPERTGFKFDGWYDKQDCTASDAVKKYGTDPTITITDHGNNGDSVTLYAKWTANQIEVVYAAGEGSGTAPAKAYFSYGTDYRTKDANTFTAPATRKVNFDANGGSVQIGTGTDKFINSTFSFSKWLSSANNTKYDADKIVSDNLGASGGTVTLTAQWTQDGITLPTPTRTGYEFAGWYDAPTGGAKITENENLYKNDKYYPPASDTNETTVYAQWTVNTLTLNLYAYSNTIENTAEYKDSNGGGTVKIGLGTAGKEATAQLNYGQGITTDSSDAEGKVLITTEAATGYKFDGWYTSSAFDTSTTIPETMPETDKTFYAKFSVIYCTVKAYAYSNTSSDLTKWANNAIGGTVAVDATVDDAAGETAEGKLTSGSAILTAAPATGYHFVGWYTSSTVSGEPDSSLTANPLTVAFTSDGDTINRYARFDVNTASLTVKPNGGTWNGFTTDQTYTQIQNSTLDIPVPTKTGYTFNKWDTSSTDSSGFAGNMSLLNAAATYTFPNNNGAADTITATYNPINYSVSYELNGGSHGTNHPTSATYGTAFAVSAPTKTGHTFTGWTVTGFQNRDDSIPLWGKTKTPDTAVTSTSSCINGTNDVYFLNLRYQTTDSVTLTANWTINQYDISLVALANNDAASATYNTTNNGGTVSGAGKFTYNAQNIISAEPAEAYQFDGWYESDDVSGSPVSTEAEYQITVTGAKTYYAKFSMKHYTIGVAAVADSASTAEFNTANASAAGCTVETSGTDIYYGKDVTLTASAGEGYTFAGWYGSSDVSGTALSSDALYTFAVTEGKTYYAKFTINKFAVKAYAYSNTAAQPGTYENNTTGGTVKFSGGTAAASVTNDSVAYNSNVTLVAEYATGYTFDGWYETNEFTGTAVSAAAELQLTVTSAKTYYAKFSITAPTVTVYAYSNANGSANYENNTTGGTVTINPANIKAGTSASGNGTEMATASIYYGTEGSVTAAANTGYTFEGWYEAVQGGSGSAITGWTMLHNENATAPTDAMTQARTFYAKFTVKSITINYNASNGTITSGASQTAYYNSDLTIGAVCSRPGYTLLGWSKTEGASTADYTTSIPLSTINSWFTGNSKTLYAVWDNLTYITNVFVASDTANNAGAYMVGGSGGTASLAEGVDFIKTGDDIRTKITYQAAAGYEFVDIKYRAVTNDPSGNVTTWSGANSVGEGTYYMMPAFENGSKVAFIVYFKVRSFDATAYSYSNSAAAPTVYSANAAGGTVKLGQTGAPGSTATGSAYYSDANGVTFYATVNTGYTFEGWYSDAALTNKLTDSTSIKVVLDDNRPTGCEDINKRYAKFTIISNRAYARAKYYTDGFDTAAGAGINGIVGGTVTVAVEGGSSATTTGNDSVSVVAAYTQTVKYMADPDTGYAFVGWYLSPDANDNVNIEEEEAIETDAEFAFIMPDGDVRIHGKFVPYNFVLVLEPNGGVSGPTAEVTLTYGRSVTLDSTAKPTRPSYTFKGWDTASSATTIVFNHENSNCTIAVKYINQWFVDNEEIIVENKDYSSEESYSVKIYAVWETANYTVILDKQGGTGGTSQVEVTYQQAMPSIEGSLPTYEGYKFMGYYDEPGGPEGSIKYYNADGTSAHTWELANGATIYAKWVCPILKEATYDEDTGKWTYTFEAESGKDKEVTADETLTKQGITDLAPSGSKEITSVDKPVVAHVETKLEEAKKINLNHYTETALDDLSESVKQTNTSLKREKLSQVGLNEYVSKMASDMEIDVPANKKTTETQKPSIKLYETDAKLSAIKAKNISNPAMSATGATYITPSSTEASSFLYTNKYSNRKNGAVDYYIYTNSPDPVIALEIDDGTVGYNSASYPTKATVDADASEAIVPEFSTDSYSTGAVAATEDISTAWFTEYTKLGIGTGDGSDEDNVAYDYNAKTVVYLTPSFATGNKLESTNEIVYTITPSDDAYTANTGVTESRIADVPTGPKASLQAFVGEQPTDEESITVCICYHNAMNGTSDEGGVRGDPYFQLYIDQTDYITSSGTVAYMDTWLNQMHIYRQSGGANNWEIIYADEAVYPVDDPNYRDSDYIFGSFAYVFDSTNEPVAASYAEAGNMELAKQAIIKSVNDTASDKHDAIMNYSNPEHLQHAGLGLFNLGGWSTNFYPKKGSYVYAHIIDRWGNYFNKVWKCFNVDDYTALISGKASTGFTIDEDGGSNLASITINGADIDFFTDIDSSYEDNIFITTGNQFKISTGKPKSYLEMTVTDNAGNAISGKIPTDADGNITFTVNDACMDLSSGAYTFKLNDKEVNLYACEPALVRDASMTAIAIVETAATVTVKTSDEAAKIQLVENGVTRTYYNGQSGVDVVDNGDGTLTWTVDLKHLTIGKHSFDVKGKDKAGTWHDSVFTINTLIIEMPVETKTALQSIDNTSAMVGERAVHKVITREGTESVRVIYDNGYSKTAYSTNTPKESVGSGLEVWTITGGAINAAGTYTVSSYAKYDGNWQKDNTLTGTITVKEKAKDSAEIYSIDVVNSTIRAGERAEFTVLTNAATVKLQVVLPGTTTTLTPENVLVEDNGDGTLTWYISKSYKTVGENDIVLKAKGETGWTEAQTFGTVDVIK